MRKSFFNAVLACTMSALSALTLILTPANVAKAATSKNASGFEVIKQDDSILGLTSGNDVIDVQAGESYIITQRYVLATGAKVYYDPALRFKSDDGMVKSFELISMKNPKSPSTSQVRIRESEEMEVVYKITISEYAPIGRYKYGMNAISNVIAGYDEFRNPIFGNAGYFFTTINVVSSKVNPTFTVVGNPEFSAKSGEYVDVTVVMKNAGDIDAYDTYVSLNGSAELMPVDTPLRQKVGVVKAGESFVASFRFMVDANAQTNRITMPITVTARTLAQKEVSEANYNAYININGAENKKSTFNVKNVVQSPEKPVTGEKVTLTFDLENYGDTDLRNIKVFVNNLGQTFEPVSSDPYQIIGDLDAWNTKKVTVEALVGNGAINGTNSMGLSFKAEEKTGALLDGSAEVYVLNVSKRGDLSGSSKPKLMVADFFSDKAELNAGDIFTFTFKVKNTNAASVARNTKVKVTSSHFSVTAGSNSFFIGDIEPGQETEVNVNLKASAALTTGAYPITVSMDYEYDGMPVSYENGVSVQDELLLQVNELLRASCENISVGDWNGVTVNSPTPLSFEFYNMGRSQLNNVYVTVEGDFVLSTGNSYYIGNINAGYPEYVECTVTPLVEGDAVCRIILHMEDSNGDEVVKVNEKTVYVGDGSNIFFPGGLIDDGGFIEDGGFIDDGMMPENEIKTGLSLIWKIAIGAGAVILVAGITVAIVIVVKKKSKKDKEEEFDD